MEKTSQGVATCTICKETFNYPGGSTSNLRRHITTKHAASEGASQLETKSNKECAPKDVASKSTLFQPTLQSTLSRTKVYEPESAKKKFLDDLVVNMIVKDLQPFSVVEDEGFRSLVAGLDPKYQLPSRRTITRKLLPSKYEEQSLQLKSTLSQVDHIAITTDLWTSRRTESYITVTAHYLCPSPSWELQTAVLATKLVTVSHTAENIAAVLKDVFQEWDIEAKISSIVTDNASAMVSLVKDHMRKHHVRCFAHSLNLIVRESIKKSEEMTPLLSKVKAIVTYFHHSVKGSEKLKSVQTTLGLGQKKLVQDVETRWNSTLKMAQRYIEEHQAVTGALCGLGKAEMSITDDEVRTLEKMVNVLTPFDLATREMSGEKYPSLSKMLPTVRQIMEFLATEEPSSLRDHLQAEMRRRFTGLQDNVTLCAATFLDPRFKKLTFTDQDSLKKVEDRLKALMNRMAPLEHERPCSSQDITEDIEEREPPLKKSLWGSFDDRVDEISKTTTPALTGPIIELRRYNEMGYLKRLQDPLQWWKENQAIFPKLSAVARQFLHIPATSVPSERLFSKAGELISVRRSCLKATNVDKILFLNKKPSP
ncbi:zinc finger BED domain-containing protein 4 [Elysia marginata]|uniref:Zinc finger BED domain-containing protein 4 n=1 Tax=Elysia marginata TaxID=1093978 RepID=A0AAV4H1F4_9GAST|nr:zinc finger BED domain-containing protein 4 [Elysia marginata]